jgi:hypothetical protein
VAISRIKMGTLDLFTHNKQTVREMNTKLIDRYLGNRKGSLRYIGLPASTLTDVIQWKEYFQYFSAVERGKPGEEYRYQHKLMLTAMQHGIAGRLNLLRGDMDEILMKGGDNFGNRVLYPYDVVSLDYSGGLVYKDDSGKAKRPQSIAKLFEEQAKRDRDFLLFISTNIDNEDQGEVRNALLDIERELNKLGVNVGQTVQGYIGHELEEARLKVYVPYLISNLAARWYQCEHAKAIYYEGNRGTRMMNFSTWLKRSQRYVAGRPSRQTIIHILNLPAYCCAEGDLEETDFGIPKIQVPKPIIAAQNNEEID